LRADWLVFIINKSTDGQNFNLCELSSSTFNFQLSNRQLFNQRDFLDFFKVVNQKARKAIENVRVILNKIHLFLFTAI